MSAELRLAQFGPLACKRYAAMARRCRSHQTTPFWFFICASVIVVGWWPLCGHAQIVRGRVTEALSHVPIPGAVVSLSVDANVSITRSTLTDANGRYAVVAPGPGTYLLEVRSIGFTRRKSTLSLGAGETSIADLTLTRDHVRLSEVRVAERNGCRRPDALPNVGLDIWNDLWTALTASILSREQLVKGEAVLRYTREFDEQVVRLRTETRRIERGNFFSPFVAAAAPELARNGFIREQEDGELQVFAPDAATFLSTDFISRHCFAITRNDSGGVHLLGMMFWPHRDFTSRGIEGVFWLDAATRELRQVVFTFPRLTRLSRGGEGFGGQVSFARRTGAGWYVSRWWLRVPVVSRERKSVTWAGRRVEGDTRDSVVAVAEEGGIVFNDSTGAPLGSIKGRVVDASGTPLPGTDVELLGTSLFTRTDANGNFELDRILTGTYALRTLGFGADSTSSIAQQSDVRIVDGVTQTVVVTAVPNRTQAAYTCGSQTGKGETSALVGIARDINTRAPLPLRTIDARWIRFAIEGSKQAITMRTEIAHLTTDSVGFFRICAAPPRAYVGFRARGTPSTAWTWPVEIGTVWTVLQLNFDSVGLVREVLGPRPIALQQLNVISDEETVFWRVQGTVLRNDSTVTPLEGVEIQLDGKNPAVRTTVDGLFVIDSVERGVHVVSLRRVGYLPQNAVLSVGDEKPSSLHYRMSPTTRLLETVIVEGVSESQSIGMRGFAERRVAHFGIFIGAEELQRFRGGSLASLIQLHVRGFDLVPLERGGMSAGLALAARRFRSLGSGRPQPCFSQVYIDGQRAGGQRDGPFDLNQLKQEDIAGMEFYRGASETPSEFSGPNAACGTLVIWTRAR